MSKYKYREDYFKTITPRAAYILGWLWSDGFVIDKDGVYQAGISLKDTLDNRKVLRFIANELIIGGRELLVRKPTNGYHSDTTMVNLSIYNKIIVKDLERLGCIPRKSLILKPPKVLFTKEEFTRFLQGVVEGDGSFFYRREYAGTVGLTLSVTGTREMCSWLKENIKDFYGINGGCASKITSKNTYILTYVCHQARRVRNFIYNGAFCCLESKKTIAYQKMCYKDYGLLTLREVARVLNKSISTIRYRVKVRLVSYVQFGNHKYYKPTEIVKLGDYLKNSELNK